MELALQDGGPQWRLTQGEAKRVSREAMASDILTLNAGSSSLKFSLWQSGIGIELRELFRGEIEKIGIAPHLFARESGGRTVIDSRFEEGGAKLSHEDLLRELFARLSRQRQAGFKAIGHRVVHGGARFTAPVGIDDDVMEQLSKLESLAPLHQPHNLAGIRICAALQPGVPQVACFDTAFHRTMDSVARRLGLPRVYEEEGVQRYGFHGLSYEFIAHRLRTIDPDLAKSRVIVAHLGNGASLCAMHDGHSVDTTMGFTALDGLLMGTRPGALDPGAVTYLMREHGMSASEIEDLLYHRSGLLGVSGTSSDMRTLLASDDLRAREAVELFVFRVVREIGALTTSMGGIDGLVFTAGIGEHASEIRSRVCARCAWLGVVLDENANRAGLMRITAEASRICVYVIPTDEEKMIAEHTVKHID
jgi:acetate kinase